jgi:hypothetical protein
MYYNHTMVGRMSTAILIALSDTQSIYVSIRVEMKMNFWIFAKS